MTTTCASAVAYLVSGLVVLLFPPRVGSAMRGTVAWWLVGAALFLAYVGTFVFLHVRCASGPAHPFIFMYSDIEAILTRTSF